MGPVGLGLPLPHSFPQSCGAWSSTPSTPNLSFSSPFWESRLEGGLLPAPLTSLSELPTKALRGLRREGPGSPRNLTPLARDHPSSPGGSPTALPTLWQSGMSLGGSGSTKAWGLGWGTCSPWSPSQQARQPRPGPRREGGATHTFTGTLLYTHNYTRTFSLIHTSPHTHVSYMRDVLTSALDSTDSGCLSLPSTRTHLPHKASDTQRTVWCLDVPHTLIPPPNVHSSQFTLQTGALGCTERGTTSPPRTGPPPAPQSPQEDSVTAAWCC